ncbi:MAG: alanine--glyoxylate aminotransferase family protein [Anaerolineales bacterium]|jgi:alanine-glyoxylate transaminase/serine-glyoxylate transaminase/serine-pyruvate transaminase
MDPNNYKDLDVPSRILLGPGPSVVDPRVLRVMTAPLVGHLDPQFIQVMDDVQELLRYVFQTKNEITLPISGTGSAGMEASICNFVEPGDKMLVGICGYFGERMAEMGSRYGAEVKRLERPWGEVFTPEEIDEALSKDQYKLLALVHGETSTGVCQRELKAIAEIAHKHGALLLIDAVASLGGTELAVDAWGVDICYSGSQKALSAPPGLAPLTISPRAEDVLKKRKTKVTSWYLDLSLLLDYWTEARRYHHTAPISMNYALREALRLVAEEGLEARLARHRKNAETLWAGLEHLDLPLLVPEENRLVTLTTPKIPGRIDDVKIRSQLREEYNIEIAGGFGPLAGKVWRIGLMGNSCRKENVVVLLAALETLLK